MTTTSWIHQNCRFAQVEGWLLPQLKQLRPQMAEAAQRIYDSWDQTDEFQDGGGICDEIAEAISGIVASSINSDLIDISEYGHDGDDHAAIIVSAMDLNTGRPTERYLVDIPYDLYETGGGYNWTKIPDVIFMPQNVVIQRI